MATNEVNAVFGTTREAETRPLYQYDYGMKLVPEGVELPASYEVHFSNYVTGGSAVISIGEASGVKIPSSLLETGNDVHAYIFLHEGTTDGETVYHVHIPVIPRAKATEPAPSGDEETAIAQLLDVANNTVNRAQAAAESAEASAQRAEEAAGEIGDLSELPARVAAIETALNGDGEEDDGLLTRVEDIEYALTDPATGIMPHLDDIEGRVSTMNPLVQKHEKAIAEIANDLEKQGGINDQLEDHETRITALEEGGGGSADLEKRVEALEVVSELIETVGFSQPTIDMLPKIAAAGLANKIPVGTQIITPYAHEEGNIGSFNIVWDVVGALPFEDEKGNQYAAGEGVWLQAHYAVPYNPYTFSGIAAVAVDTTETTYQEGWYYGKKNNSYWDGIDVTYGDAISDYTNLYKTRIPAGFYSGNTRYKDSQWREWLNSAGAGWHVPVAGVNSWVKAKEIPSGFKGFLSGFDSKFVDMLHPVKVPTAIIDGNEAYIDYTYDKVFLPSTAQLNIEPEYAGEGDPLPYWVEAIGATKAKPEESYEDGSVNTETYDAFNIYKGSNSASGSSTSKATVFTRSAWRNLSASKYYGSILSLNSGKVSRYGASVGTAYVTPMVVIYKPKGE